MLNKKYIKFGLREYKAVFFEGSVFCQTLAKEAAVRIKCSNLTAKRQLVFWISLCLTAQIEFNCCFAIWVHSGNACAHKTHELNKRNDRKG